MKQRDSVSPSGASETTDAHVDAALAMGADAFVFKPVTTEELEGALKKALPSG